MPGLEQIYGLLPSFEQTYAILQYAHMFAGLFLILFTRRWQWVGLMLFMSAVFYMFAVEPHLPGHYSAVGRAEDIYFAYARIDLLFAGLFVVIAFRGDCGAKPQAVLLSSIAIIHCIAWMVFVPKPEVSIFLKYWYSLIGIGVNVAQLIFLKKGIGNGIRNIREDFGSRRQHVSFMGSCGAVFSRGYCRIIHCLGVTK